MSFWLKIGVLGGTIIASFAQGIISSKELVTTVKEHADSKLQNTEVKAPETQKEV